MRLVLIVLVASLGGVVVGCQADDAGTPEVHFLEIRECADRVSCRVEPGSCDIMFARDSDSLRQGDVTAVEFPAFPKRTSATAEGALRFILPDETLGSLITLEPNAPRTVLVRAVGVGVGSIGRLDHDVRRSLREEERHYVPVSGYSVSLDPAWNDSGTHLDVTLAATLTVGATIEYRVRPMGEFQRVPLDLPDRPDTTRPLAMGSFSLDQAVVPADLEFRFEERLLRCDNVMGPSRPSLRVTVPEVRWETASPASDAGMGVPDGGGGISDGGVGGVPGIATLALEVCSDSAACVPLRGVTPEVVAVSATPTAVEVLGPTRPDGQTEVRLSLPSGSTGIQVRVSVNANLTDLTDIGGPAASP